MDDFFKCIGYAATAWFSLFAFWRVMIAVLAARRAFECPENGSFLRLFLRIFFEALMDRQSYLHLYQKTVWWNGMASGSRWDAIDRDSDKSGWAEGIANGHAAGNRFFTVHGVGLQWVGEDHDPTIFREYIRVAKKAFIDLCPAEIDGHSRIKEVVRVDTFGPFDWSNFPDRQFLEFLLGHFRKTVVIRVTPGGNAEHYSGSYWGCDLITIKGDSYAAFGLGLGELGADYSDDY